VVELTSPTLPQSLKVGHTLRFTVSLTGNKNTAVTWSVNGTQGDSSTVGTMSTIGLCTGPSAVPSQRSRGWWELVTGQVNVGKREVFGRRVVPANADAMSSATARSLGTSPSVMRPISPYLKAPPLAHSTTSPIACFLVVATRRAAVRNSLRSWLNPELAADPLPLLGAGEERVPLARGLANPFPPETLVPFPTGAGLSKHNHEAHRGGPRDYGIGGCFKA